MLSRTILHFQQQTLARLQRGLPRTAPAHIQRGDAGEQAAMFFLRSLGYTVVAQQWRSAFVSGDLDLLAWDGPTLVAVEVKTRADARVATAESAVDERKQNQVRKLVNSWLRQLPKGYRDAVPVRFDVVSVYFEAKTPRFEHFRDVMSR